MLMFVALLFFTHSNVICAQPIVAGESWADIGKDTRLTCSPRDGEAINLMRWKNSTFNVSDIVDTEPIVQLTFGTDPFIRDETHYEFDKNDPSYPLTIKQLTLDDEARYWCEMFVISIGTYESSFIDTQIRAPPDSVSLTYKNIIYNDQDDVEVVAGDGHQFSCETLGIKPNADFTWILQSTTLHQGLPGTTSPNGDDSRLNDSSSTVSVNVPESPATQQLTCGATNRQDGSTDTEKDTTVNLQVKVPPKSSKITLPETNQDGTLSVDEGLLKTITCIVMDTRPAATIKWFLNGVMQSTGTVAPPSADSDQLYDTTGSWPITPTRNNHKDEVMCQARTPQSQGVLPNVTATLNVNGPPDLPTITGNTQMTENVQISLMCAADMGYPDDWRLHWFNEETALTPNPTTVPSSSGNRFMFTSTLDFTPMREYNGHTIKCDAQRNSMSSSKGTLGPIDVQFCARSVSIEACETATAGNTAVLRCVSDSSNPATTLKWSRDGVDQTDTTPQLDSDGSNGGIITTLDITTNVLTKDDNGAVFQCNGSNDVVMCGVDGVDVTHSCTLNVQYTPEFTEPTVITETPVIEGGEVILTCTADANPKPLDFIVWEKLDSSNTVPSTVYNDGIGTLTLSNIQREQAGSYRCKANNEIPTTDSDVFSKPVIVKVYYEVGITNKNENEMGVKDDKDAFLLCKAVGNPMPVMTWYDPNNTVITSTRNPDKYTVEDTTTSGDDIYGFMVTSNLTIKRVDSQVDYGVYTCNSSNGIGQVDMLTVLLNGTRRPDKPFNVSLSDRTSSSIAVDWRAGYSGGEPQWFQVGYKKTGDSPENSSDKIDGGVTTYNVVGLDPYTKYEIKVYAENEVDRNPSPGRIVTYTLPVSVAKAGITIEFNVDEGTVTVSGLKDGGGCIQLEVTYGGPSNWSECGECISADSEVVLAKQCPQTQKRSRRAVGNVDDVRAKHCQGSDNDKLCSGSVRAERVMNPQGSSSGGIIAGGLVGGIFLVVIIIILIWYLRKTSPSDPKSSHTDTSSIELATDNFGRNGQVNEGLQGSAQSNRGQRGSTEAWQRKRLSRPGPQDGEPLREKYTRTSGYISLPEPVDDEPETPTTTWSVDQATKTDESLHMTPAPRPMSTTGEGGAERSAKPAAVERMVTDTGDTYALVNKEKPKDKSPPPNLPDVTYADVNKKAQAKRPKKYVPPSKADQESEYEDVRLPPQNMKSKIGAGASGYEVVNLDSPKTSTADEENDYADVSQHQSPSGRTVNEDGLIYMEVGHYKKHPVNQPPIQTEESTTYASIDFKRLVAPDVAK